MRCRGMALPFTRGEYVQMYWPRGNTRPQPPAASSAASREPPARLGALDAGRLFGILRDVDDIDAMVVTERLQRAVELSSRETTLRLAP